MGLDCNEALRGPPWFKKQRLANFGYKASSSPPNLNFNTSISPNASPYNNSQECMDVSLELEIAEQVDSFPANKQRQLLDVTIVQSPNDCKSSSSSKTIELNDKLPSFVSLIHLNTLQTQQTVSAQNHEVIKRKAILQQPTHEDEYIKKQFNVHKFSKSTSENTNTQINHRRPPQKLTVTSALVKPVSQTLDKSFKNHNIKRDQIAPNIPDFKKLPNLYYNNNFQARDHCDEINDTEIKSRKEELNNVFLPTDNISNAPQVYATVNPFNKLKNMLSCQHQGTRNTGAATHTSTEKEEICPCDHCATMGVLADTQKRPFPCMPLRMPASPLAKKSNHTSSADSRRNIAFDRQTSRSHFSEDQIVNLLKDFIKRLDKLEKRVSDQEDQAVPKEFFRKVMEKYISNRERGGAPISSTKNISTQFNYKEPHKGTERPDSKLKPNKIRNVQIQQNERRHFTVNPVLLDANVKEDIKQINNHSEEINSRKDSQESVHTIYVKRSQNTFKNFLHWGEEIIRPGFDLKTKVMTLLEDYLNSIKNKKFIEKKSSKSKLNKDSSILPDQKCKLKTNKDNFTSFDTKPKIRDNFTSPDEKIASKATRDTSTSAIQQVMEAPEPPIKKRISESLSLNSTFMNILNLMTEKLHGDHLKDDISSKPKDKSKIDDTKTTSDFNTINKDNSQEKETPKMSPIKITLSKKQSRLTNRTASFSRKSAIPVRIGNFSMEESSTNNKQQSLIPHLKSKTKKDYDESSEVVTHNINYDSHSEKSTECTRNLVHSEYIKKIQGNTRTLKERKTVEIKYINPKIHKWKNDSSASVRTRTSCDTSK